MTEKEPELLAVYGTLIGILGADIHDQVEGYSKHMVKGRPFPAVIPTPDKTVQVYLVPISPSLIAQCDMYEGPMYSREIITTVKGERAYMYVWALSKTLLEEKEMTNA